MSGPLRDDYSDWDDQAEAELAALNAGLAASGGLYDLSALDPDLQAELDAAEAELAAAGYALGSLPAGQPLPDLGAAEAQRLAEDAQGMPMDTEARTAYLLGRIERGTYTPPQPADDAAHGCGPLDDFGRCSARFHDAYCFETARGEAVNGASPEAMDAWRGALLSGHQAAAALQLANGQLAAQTAAAASRVHDTGTYQAMRAVLGLG